MSDMNKYKKLIKKKYVIDPTDYKNIYKLLGAMKKVIDEHSDVSFKDWCKENWPEYINKVKQNKIEKIPTYLKKEYIDSDDDEVVHEIDSDRFENIVRKMFKHNKNYT